MDRSRWALVALLIAATACAGRPHRSLRTAGELGLMASEVAGTSFEHVVFGHRRVPGGRLHVYLEGDGMPWIANRYPAADPSPRDLLMLRLAASDPAAVYLGRPCYHGRWKDAACQQWHWTHGRYSEEVVASLTSATRSLVDAAGADHVVLFGHSGGGALAMLMAPRLPEVEGVVTVAGNLDPEAWASRHGYAPLVGSLSPRDLPPLDTRIRQLHLAGEGDRVVPAAMIRAALADRPRAEVIVRAGCGHAEGWDEDWQEVLAFVEAWFD